MFMIHSRYNLEIMKSTIQLAEILSAYPDLTAAGDKFYADVRRAVEKSGLIKVDMKDVTSLPSIFLNVSFGKLIDEFGMDAVRRMFTFSNITKTQAERLQKYFSAYKH